MGTMINHINSENFTSYLIQHQIHLIKNSDLVYQNKINSELINWAIE